MIFVAKIAPARAKQQGMLAMRRRALYLFPNLRVNAGPLTDFRTAMIAFRAALLATAALLLGAGTAMADAAVPAAGQVAGRNLPPGLTQRGSVIMMAPIADDASGNGPSITGERRPGLVRVLGAADRDLYLKAFEAADRGDWTAAKGLADQGHDPIARRLIEWRYLLDKNGGASFGEIGAFLKANPDWPARDTLFARAEAAIDPNMDPHAVAAWFGDRAPVSDIGRIRLGEAYLATGRVAQGRDLIRQAWIAGSFDLNQEFDIIRRHGDVLTPDVDRERLNRLLWNNDLSAARRELSRVPSDTQQLAQARLSLRTSPSQGAQLVGGLSPSQQDDPGLIFDRARLLRQQNAVDAIPPLLSRAPTRQMAQINPGKWWNELNLAARQALQNKSYATAYGVVSNSGLSSGNEFAEAEFMAGWLDLRFLNNPRGAHTHFQNLAKGVGRPISKARGYYWEGRASEAAGDVAQAAQEYRLAAQAPETFYGQLALAKIDSTPHLHLTDVPADAAAVKGEYERRDTTRAMRVLGDLGMVSLLRAFATHEAETHSDPRYLKAMASDLVEMGFRDVALRVAKTASYAGANFFAYLHPVISVPAYSGPGVAPEPAYVLGIIRQETEFDPSAVSGPGARGIMQLMPSSAKRAADMAGLTYRPNDLIADTAYNMQLGMTELSEDLSTYGGSYILAAAAYNAGKANVNKWLDTYGDPRSPTVNPIDWIEEIPFSETRNYVQRVLENTQVYRNRLSGHDEPLRILADVYRPRQPDVKPLPTVPASIRSENDGPYPAPRPSRAAE
jgi:peptidoglycan lytic transglycosylase